MKYIISAICCLLALQGLSQPMRHEIVSKGILSSTRKSPDVEIKTYYGRDGNDSIVFVNGKLAFTYKWQELPNGKPSLVRFDEKQREDEWHMFTFYADSSFDIEIIAFGAGTISTSRYAKDHRQLYYIDASSDTSWLHYTSSGKLEKIIQSRRGKDTVVYRSSFNKKGQIESIHFTTGPSIGCNENEYGLISEILEYLDEKKKRESAIITKITYEFY
ncbi:MAG TPA: hypothetical protein VD993_16310 [Chitinophagaceae bacterium]|nr:hypothetical protein [Chitinophagaceae bacterium]